MKVNDGYEASGSMSSEDEEESSYEDVEVEVEDESGDNSLGVGGVDQSESQGLMLDMTQGPPGTSNAGGLLS